MGIEGDKLTPDLATSPSDSAPDLGGIVQRTVGGRKVRVPIVSQARLAPPDGPLELERQVNTQRRLRKPTPRESLGVESAESVRDPLRLRQAENRARKQRYAIARKTKGRSQRDGR